MPISLDSGCIYEVLFSFGSFKPSREIALRTKLQPQAEANDPVTSYWLAKTYDWYKFGIGRKADFQIAMKWYRQAVNLNYRSAAYFLYEPMGHIISQPIDLLVGFLTSTHPTITTITA
jgi:hypothetical protein